MRLELGGHPLHSRALTVAIAARDGGRLAASADLLDLRKRGFVPVGTALQGAGVIHQMGVDAVLERMTLVVERLDARQPVVAFEASAATAGESCRDVVPGLASLVGCSAEVMATRVRTELGGAAGCSHLVAALQLLCATLAESAELWRATAESQLRRDLVFDGCELDDGRLAVGVQLSDLETVAAPPAVRPVDRLVRHRELRVQLVLNGWPATIDRATGAERVRLRDDFPAGPWQDLAEALAPLQGLNLAKGANREIVRLFGDRPALREALLQLAPALIQCRASFPDKWLDVAVTRAGHPGLIGMPDSCYMWRRGGALEAKRNA